MFKWTFDDCVKYGNIGCQVSNEGIQIKGKFLSKNQLSQRKFLYFVNRHSTEPSDIGHHFKRKTSHFGTYFEVPITKFM